MEEELYYFPVWFCVNFLFKKEGGRGVFKSINYIHASYVTVNTYFVEFVIPDVNKFLMPCFNCIYKNILNKKALVF